MQFITPKKYIDLLYKVFFDSRSLTRETQSWGKIKERMILIQLSIYHLLTVYSIIAIIIVFLDFIVSDLYFPESIWSQSLLISITISIGVALAVAISVCIGVAVGFTKGIAKGVTVEVILSIAFVIGGAVGAGIAFAISSDISIEPALVDFADIAFGSAFGVALGYASGVSFGIWFGSFIGLVLAIVFSMGGSVSVGMGFLPGYCFAFYSLFYWPFYMFPFVKRAGIMIFPHPKWEEDFGLPVPFMSKILLNQAAYNKIAAIKEAGFLIRNIPAYRKGAQKGLMLIAIREMKNFQDVKNIAQLREELNFIPHFDGFLPEEFDQAFQSILFFAHDVRIALNEHNDANKLLQFKKIIQKLNQFQNRMDFTKGKIGLWFGAIVSNWQFLVLVEIDRLTRDKDKPLPNPYITGNPIRPEFREVFVGRRDIIEQIQTETLRQGGAGAILFIGRRRSGKTSTLLNMGSYLSSDFIPIFADCQSPLINSSLNQFIKTIAKEIGKALDINNMNLANFNTLASLTEFIEGSQPHLFERGKYVLLCFDEFEKLSDNIIDGTLPGLPDTLRYWIQHLPNFIFLLASSHPLNEIKGIDWTDYLINVRTIPISYLDFDSALQLVTKPVSEFDLIFDPPEISALLVRRLGCQPYFLQVVMFELVQYLNERSRKTSQRKDIDIAVEKMFKTASTHFHHIWGEEIKEPERNVLFTLTHQQRLTADLEQAAKALVGKEILYKKNRSYSFCVPVLREWILKNV